MSVVIDEQDRVCVNCKHRFDDGYCIHIECSKFDAGFGYETDGFVPSERFLKEEYNCLCCKHRGTEICSGCRMNTELPDLWERKE